MKIDESKLQKEVDEFSEKEAQKRLNENTKFIPIAEENSKDMGPGWAIVVERRKKESQLLRKKLDI